jgi:hypothetical protein
MKIAMNFTDGSRIVQEDIGQIELYKEKEMFSTVQEWKEKDTPITIKNMEGETFNKSGRELVSFEIIPD